MPSCVENGGQDDDVDLKGTLFSVGWGGKSDVGKSEPKMLRVNKYFVSETVNQLCSCNTVLNKVGVTWKQLHAVLTLRLSRNTSSHSISILIEKSEQSKYIIRNSFGNYIMNPNNFHVEDASSDKGVNSTELTSHSDKAHCTSNKSNMSKDVINPFPSPQKSTYSNDKLKKRTKSNKVEECEEEYEEIEECSLSPSSQEKVEPEEDEDDKPLARRRGRKKRKPKVEEDEEDGDGESLSSQDKMEVEEVDVKPLPKKRGRKKKIIPKVEEEVEDDEEEEGSESPSLNKPSRVVVSTNNGRRVIRKITKYDPSEYYLTPLIRKKTKNVVAEEPKKRLKRGRPPLKPKVAAATPTSPIKRSEQPKCYSNKTGKTSVDAVKTTTGKNKAFSVINDDDDESDDESSSDVESSSDTMMPPSILVKSKASMLRNECYICSKEALVSDETSVLACSLCLNIAHKDCVEDDGFYKKLKRWRCNQCLLSHPAVCFTCNKGYDKNDGVMLTCDNCEEMFHARCHVPFVKRPFPTAPWRCSFCPRLTITDSLIGGRKDLNSDVGTFAYNIEKKLEPETNSLPEPENKEELVLVSKEESVCTAAPQLEEPVCTTAPQLEERVCTTAPLLEEPVCTTAPQLEEPVCTTAPLLEEPVCTTAPHLEVQPEPVEGTPEAPVQPCLDQLIEIKKEAAEEMEESKVEEEEDLVRDYKYHRPGEPIPTVDEWSPKQVADYFSMRFGQTVGNAFLSQEIDGRSLKLLKRDDVTQRLGLQFGIALKVLYYVKKIQLKTNVIHKLWT